MGNRKGKTKLINHLLNNHEQNKGTNSRYYSISNFLHRKSVCRFTLPIYICLFCNNKFSHYLDGDQSIKGW